VSGPEVLDKFVGSSEKNLRAVFDSPPDIYDFFRIGEPNNGDDLAQAALHVVVMDEFDAIARTRGGAGGKGDQGDAGVARDSVVNQLLAKMDGVEPLSVPTLVIGLTNKRSLVDEALLRPGRFEVQIEVPPPKTEEQRVSILKVHTHSMYEAGRLLVADAPPDSPAAWKCQNSNGPIPTYEELLHKLAKDTAGFSGASLAGIARAAASHALERAVDDFTSHVVDDDIQSSSSSLLTDCLVSTDDLISAVKDVKNSQGRTDWEEEDEQDDTE
jgi:SpoVK/Ycf46/Vps4 family AAA+-type ATPase